MTKDPVCGMEVDPSRAVTASFHDTRFFFCSPACKAAFEEAPGDYEALWCRVPAALPRLLELARNLWWAWHPEARALFETLAGGGLEHGDGNPVELLLATPVERLAARAEDPRVLALYREVLAAFDRDMAASPAWTPLDARGTPAAIAYFSAEFGVHHSLPVYSGGLGVLAGDTAKEASDLAIPLVGVGFMYPQGYFRQRVSADGWQEERYERLDRPRAPAEPACTEAGQRCVITIPLPGRRIDAAVWVVRVEPAKRVLQEVYRAATDRTHEGRIAFVEDYDMQAARYLVQGVDVWLNTPRSPLEASGTSGMKAALNGIPNLSVSDGWWAEGHDGTNGWVIGSADPDDQTSRGDAADAGALYRVLEPEAVPRFYERDQAGVPVRWVHLMRRAIQTVAPRFSTRRMLKEYVERLYRPALRGTGAGEDAWP
jgi:glucan phosphorylase/YHS domain-containing protein